MSHIITPGEEAMLASNTRSSSPLQWQHIMKDPVPDSSPSPSMPPPSPATAVVAEHAVVVDARGYDEKFFRVRGFRSMAVTKGASSVASKREPLAASLSRSNSARSIGSTASSRRSASSAASVTSRASAPTTTSKANSGALSALKNRAQTTAEAAVGQKKQVSFRLSGRRSTSSKLPKPKGTPAQRLARSASTPSSLSSKPGGADANTPAQRPDRSPPPSSSSSSTPSKPGKRAGAPAGRLNRSASSSEKHPDVPPPPPPYRPRQSQSLSSSRRSRRHVSIPAPAQRPSQDASPSTSSPPSPSATGHATVAVEEISSRTEEGFPLVTIIYGEDELRHQPPEEGTPLPDESSPPTSDYGGSMAVSMGVADSILGKLGRRNSAPSPFSYGFKAMFVEESNPPPAPVASPTPPRHKKKYSEVIDQDDSGDAGRQETPPAGAADFRSVKWRESPKEDVVMCPGCLRHVGKESRGSASNSSNSNNSNSRSGYWRGGRYSSDEDTL